MMCMTLPRALGDQDGTSVRAFSLAGLMQQLRSSHQRLHAGLCQTFIDAAVFQACTLFDRMMMHPCWPAGVGFFRQLPWDMDGSGTIVCHCPECEKGLTAYEAVHVA